MTRTLPAIRPGSHYRFRDVEALVPGPGWLAMNLSSDASRPVLWYREELRVVVLLGRNRSLTHSLAALGFVLAYRDHDHRVFLGRVYAEPVSGPLRSAKDSRTDGQSTGKDFQTVKPL